MFCRTVRSYRLSSVCNCSRDVTRTYADECSTAALESVLVGCHTQVPADPHCIDMFLPRSLVFKKTGANPSKIQHHAHMLGKTYSQLLWGPALRSGNDQHHIFLNLPLIGRCDPYARTSAPKKRFLVVRSLPSMRLAQQPHVSLPSRLVQAKMSAWSVKARCSPPSRHSRGARVYGHTTTAMHDVSTPPPRPKLEKLQDVILIKNVSYARYTLPWAAIIVGMPRWR